MQYFRELVSKLEMKTALILVLATIVALSAPSRSSIKLVITKPNISSRSSALRWLSWKEIRSMMAEGSWDFKKQGHFVRPGRYPGNIYGGRFICKAAVGDQNLGKGKNFATTIYESVMFVLQNKRNGQFLIFFILLDAL